MIKILDLNFLGANHTIASYLLETSAGPVLFETGPHSTFPQLEKNLAEHGYRAEEVQHVFVTHIHLDHAGAAWAFAEKGATVYVHPFGVRHLSDPSKLMASARRIYQEEMDRLWGEMNAIAGERLHPTAHEESITVGDQTVKAWHTPGHAVHHIAWQVGDLLFTGDVAGVKIDDGIVVPPCPPPDINIEDWQASIELIKKLPLSRLYLTHYGPVTEIRDHLATLERRLLEWANWMKPFYEQGTDPNAITPQFEAFVRKELENHGISEEGLERYEYANPSWMSVAGLLRYWKKREEKS